MIDFAALLAEPARVAEVPLDGVPRLLLEAQAAHGEVAAADLLAIQVIGSLMLVTCPSCGGDSWRTAGLDGERCVDCGAWSPCSRPNDAWGAAAR